METDKIDYVLCGVGEIGMRLFNALERKEKARCIGAVDIDSKKIGEDIGSLSGVKKVGVIVKEDLEKLLTNKHPDLVILTTFSSVEKVEAQLRTAITKGVNIISSCEELAFPSFSSPKIANSLDQAAKNNSVSVLGTGINPGFLMDTLPMVLTGMSKEVNSIEVTREIDASKRREPFQQKIGSGLTAEEFEEVSGIGHVGLPESISMLASAIGWSLDHISISKAKPLMADERIETDYMEVESEHVAGLSQVAEGKKNNESLIELNFTAQLNNSNEYDEIIVDGVPQINQKIKPSINGDIGTVAVMANLIPTVVGARAGLLTMKDIVQLSFF